MAGQLSDANADILEIMIGTGPKTFTLIYSIAKDGCSAPIFHQKCDKKGPTVTVLYNDKDSIFGGYTSAQWVEHTSGTYTKDSKAFLYQLQFSGKRKLMRFPVVNADQAIYSHTNNGPTFGAGPNLLTFKHTVNVSGKNFPLNGSMSTHNSYDHLEVPVNDVYNEDLNVTELEVYIVADGNRYNDQVPTKPWRQTPSLDEKLLSELMEGIENIRPLSEVDIAEYRILMLGPMGSGKSSFCNTVNSVFAGRITQRAICGSSSEYSTTTAYTPYAVRLESGSTLNFRLCDTRGLEEKQGLDVMECNFLINGHVPEFYEFNPATSINLESPEFVLKPNQSDKVHCVVFVIDASTIDDLQDSVTSKMKSFRKIMNQRRIPQAVILTKIDKISRRVREGVSNVFAIEEVERMVTRVSELLGLPPNNILPVKNYVTEIQMDDTVSALALLALRQVLHFAEDYMQNLLMQKERRSSPGPARKSRPVVFGSDEFGLETKPIEKRKD